MILHTTEGVPVSIERIAEAASSVREWLSLKLRTGRCSNFIVTQLAMHLMRVPQPIGEKLVLADFHAVIDQIGGLEGAEKCRPAPTKKAAPFKGDLLQGLYHKHWFQASNLPHVLLQLNEAMGEQLIMRAMAEKYGRGNVYGRTIDEADVRLMADASVNKALDYVTRKSELTGEWIVFARLSGRNIYLALAGHDDPDEKVLRYCQHSLLEFPELRSLPCFAR